MTENDSTSDAVNRDGTLKRLVAGMLDAGKLASLEAAYRRKLADGLTRDAQVIREVATAALGDDSDFVKTLAGQVVQGANSGPSDELSLEAYCRDRPVLEWINRSWLAAVTRAMWTEAVHRRRFTAPLGRRFELADPEFVARTGIEGLEVESDNAFEAKVRFIAASGQRVAFRIGKARAPELGVSALQGVLTSVAVAAYRDSVVCDPRTTPPTPRLEIRLPSSGPKGEKRPLALASVEPRARNEVAWGSGGGWTMAANSVRGFVRLLPEGQFASYEAIVAALAYGFVLGPYETFVRPHWRGGGVAGRVGEYARSRLLSPMLSGSLNQAVRWL